DELPNPVVRAQRIGAAHRCCEQLRIPREELSFGVAEALLELPRTLGQCGQDLIVVGEDQRIAQPEGHPQRQPWLTVTERLEPLAQERDRSGIVAAGLV